MLCHVFGEDPPFISGSSERVLNIKGIHVPFQQTQNWSRKHYQPYKLEQPEQEKIDSYSLQR